MIAADLERRDDLLKLAGDLAKALRSVPVPYLESQAIASHGVSPSVLSHASSYLARARDLEAFRGFLARFDELDTMTAQNPDNPKAEHRVAREEIQALLGEHPDLSAVELLYLLSWARRLLPSKPGNGNGGTRGTGGSRRPRRPPSKGGTRPTSFKGGQMAAALQKAWNGTGPSDTDDAPPNGRRRR